MCNTSDAIHECDAMHFVYRTICIGKILNVSSSLFYEMHSRTPLQFFVLDLYLFKDGHMPSQLRFAYLNFCLLLNLLRLKVLIEL